MLKTLANSVAATGTATQTAQTTQATPLLKGRTGLVVVDMTTVTGAPTILIETSSDGTTYATAATVTLIAKLTLVEIALGTHVRARQSVAGSAGTYSAYLYAP